MLDRNEMVLRDERYAPPPQPMAPYMPQPMAPFLPPPPEQEEPSLIASIFRHLWIVGISLVIFILLACVYLNKTTPLYRSESDLLISTNIPVITPGDPAAVNTGGGNYLSTQTQLMKSSAILGRVLNRPEIAELPVFNGKNALAYLREKVEADVGHQSDIISVAISTPRPDDSAQIVNAVVSAYKDYENEGKDTNFKALLNELKPQRDDIEQQIRADQAKLDQIRQQNPNVSFMIDGQANSPILINLNAATQHYAEIRLKRSEAQATYGTSNPIYRQLIAQEQQAYLDFQDAQKRAMELNSVQAEYTKTRTDIDQEREYLRPLNDRINQLEQQQDLLKNIRSIEVTEVAMPSTSPSWPVPSQTLLVAVILGLAVGCGLAYLRDRSDNRLRSADEIQNILGVTILGVVPRMPGRRTAVARAMAVHLDPRSEVAEAYRTIRTAVYFGAAGTRARTLLVTSPEAGDGKTTSASNLAIAIAQTGRSVLLLDADFRKPTQHKNLDVNDAVGLSSVLSGTETLDRAIQRTGVDGLDILPCGAIPGNPSEILNSQEFGELVDRLALKYDHIVFDSPPVNLVTDARILGAVCDATVLVLRAEKTTRKAAEHARNALMSVGAKVIGTIVNDASRGKGYETYGGSYYGTSGMRTPGQSYPTPVTTPMRPAGGYLPRVSRGDGDVEEG